MLEKNNNSSPGPPDDGVPTANQAALSEHQPQPNSAASHTKTACQTGKTGKGVVELFQFQGSHFGQAVAVTFCGCTLEVALGEYTKRSETKSPFHVLKVKYDLDARKILELYRPSDDYEYPKSGFWTAFSAETLPAAREALEELYNKLSLADCNLVGAQYIAVIPEQLVPANCSPYTDLRQVVVEKSS